MSGSARAGGPGTGGPGAGGPAPVGRVGVLGAGVIGRVYAGVLHEAGHDVVLLARRPAVLRLRSGYVLTGGGRIRRVRPAVEAAGSAPGDLDVLVVAVRFDQLDEVLPLVAATPARQVLFLMNLPGARARVEAALPGRQVLLGFPGVGGATEGEVTRYVHLQQQPTTIGAAGGAEAAVAALLHHCGFLVEVEDDIDTWLAAHAVFISTVETWVLAHGGSAARLASDGTDVRRMVHAVREGFKAVELQGVRVRPGPLRTIFVQVPSVVAARYWSRQLRTDLGTLAIAPHARASAGTELTALRAAVLELVGGADAVPLLVKEAARLGVSPARR